MVGITLAALALFFVLRADLLLALESQYHNRIATPRLIQHYLDANKVRKLQLGAGTNNFPQWLNTDIFPEKGQAYLDATQPFPLPNGSVHYIFAEHVVEHITYAQALFMLKECRRVLAPGGKIRLVTPDLTRFVELFREPKPEATQQYIQRKLAWHDWPRTPEPETYILNQQLREWGHQFVYTPRMLMSSLEQAGFQGARHFPAGDSDDPAFAGLEARANSNVREINLYESMAIQAVRP